MPRKPKSAASTKKPAPKPKAPAKPGRQTYYSRALAREILSELRTCPDPRRVAQNLQERMGDDAPSYRTIYAWAAENRRENDDDPDEIGFGDLFQAATDFGNEAQTHDAVRLLEEARSKPDWGWVERQIVYQGQPQFGEDGKPLTQLVENRPLIQITIAQAMQMMRGAQIRESIRQRRQAERALNAGSAPTKVEVVFGEAFDPAKVLPKVAHGA